jgi:integrase
MGLSATAATHKTNIYVAACLSHYEDVSKARVKNVRNLVPYEKKFIEFTEASEAGRHMLDKVAKSVNTKIAYSKACKFLSDFLKKGLDEIVTEYQKDVQENAYKAFDKWERTFDDFAIYLGKNLHLSSSSVSSFHAGAKALINSNVPRSMRLQAKSPTVVSRTILGVTMDELKEIYNIVGVRERAIIAFLKDSGMSRADALILKKGDLEGFDKGEQWIHLNVFRAKEGVEYETFAGPNAVEALKAYFTWREKNGETLTKESPLFVTTRKRGGVFRQLNENALNSIFEIIEKDTGKVISSHRLRKFFETYMALVVRHPIVLKYWMGHKVRRSRDIEARYILPPTPEQLKLYKESYKNIDIKGSTMDDRVKELEKFKATLTPEQLETMKRLNLRKKEHVSELGEIERSDQTKENCPDGEHCEFKQISEKELLQHLKDGWMITHRLSDGEVIVRHG